jgi:ribosome-binding factor A
VKERLPQVQKLLVEKIAAILRREVSDPRVGFATVTGVTVSPDLHTAYVHVGVLGDERQKAECIEALQHAAGFIQRHLGRQIHLKHTPHLVFRLDESPEKAVALTHLIDQSLEPGGE